MVEKTPDIWLDLLREADVSPDGHLDLTDDSRIQVAERMTDLGFLRVIRARRYAITAKGRMLLSAEAPVTGLSRLRKFLLQQ